MDALQSRVRLLGLECRRAVELERYLGQRAVQAFAEPKLCEKKAVKEILEHLGLPATGPPIAPARMREAGEDIRWQDDVPEVQQSLR